jgi:outer membrane protein
MKGLVLVFVAVFAGLVVLINGAPARAASGDIKIGFVDMDRASNDSDAGKKAINELRDFMKTVQSEIEEKSKAIEKMKSDLEKQGPAMSADARKSKAEDVERSERDLQRMTEDAKQEFAKKKNELTEDVYKQIIEIVGKYGQDEKYYVILPVQSLLYSDKTHDITDIIIKKFNEQKGAKLKS